MTAAIEEEEMKSRRILFSAPMVRALLDGRKTQARRLVKFSVYADGSGIPSAIEPSDRYPGEWEPWHDGEKCNSIFCPFGVVGDELFVKETMWRNGGYVATSAAPFANCGKVSALFCSRADSRITLRITDVRVERLQEISEADAKAEGIQAVSIVGDKMPEGTCLGGGLSAREMLSATWNSLHGPGSWESNPWVWALTFRVAKPATEEKKEHNQ